MSTGDYGFVEWVEQFISEERGNRVVHYYVKDTSGESFLAVIGKERTRRHMLFHVADEFVKDFGSSNNSISDTCKWRARREVIDWLNSLLLKQHRLGEYSRSLNFSLSNAAKVSMAALQGPFSKKLRSHQFDIVWLGDAETCSKQLKHYSAFGKDRLAIAVHSFVCILSEEAYPYLAYIVDMYEDKKGQKKVKLRWFHSNEEIKDLIPTTDVPEMEIFLTDCIQIISAECVDCPVTVLTPEHYEKCLGNLSHNSLARIYQCSRQLKSDSVKPCDLCKLEGYFDQEILPRLGVAKIEQGKKKVKDSKGNLSYGTNPATTETSGKRTQITAGEPENPNLTIGSDKRELSGNDGKHEQVVSPYKVGKKIELLCQDSGIRGCWFRCTILKVHAKRLKVLYEDVQDADDTGNLKEWIPIREAAPDKLRMRCPGRLTIRPWPSKKDLKEASFEIGTPVDAWYCDGWWEGVVTKPSDGKTDLKVYLPGESRFITIHHSDLRISRDWVNNKWVDVAPKPDILSVIAAVLRSGTKLNLRTKLSKGSGSGSGSSGVANPEVPNSAEVSKKESAGSDGAQEKVASVSRVSDYKWIVKVNRGWELAWFKEDKNRNDSDNAEEKKLDVK